MPVNLTTLQIALLCSPVAFGAPTQTQAPRDSGRTRPPGPVEVQEVPTEPGIAWFGTWEAALAEAKRTGRPILFHSAAPKCQNVPGVW